MTEVILAVRWDVPLELPAGLGVATSGTWHIAEAVLLFEVAEAEGVGRAGDRGPACARGTGPSDAREHCAPLLVWLGGCREEALGMQEHGRGTVVLA